MTRQEVLDICSTAYSRSEVEAAMISRSRYLTEHPTDGAVLDVGAMLSRSLDALNILGVDDIEPAPFPVVAEREAAGVT